MLEPDVIVLATIALSVVALFTSDARHQGRWVHLVATAGAAVLGLVSAGLFFAQPEWSPLEAGVHVPARRSGVIVLVIVTLRRAGPGWTALFFLAASLALAYHALRVWGRLAAPSSPAARPPRG